VPLQCEFASRPDPSSMARPQRRGDRRAIFIADWTGVQVTLWQLGREKSLIAKRSKMKGNSGHTSKANFGGDICEFESSHPSQPVRSLLFDFPVWVNHSPSDSSGKDRERHLSSIARLRHLRRCHHVVLWLLTSSNQNRCLAAALEALKSKQRRIPFIDPIDIRYRRFETTPKPLAQAVMFCLMDVSGSMSEHMKDLAKRFYMLLYVFLTRRYRHVEIVFIRHTDRAEEVDEVTFFHHPASGGTLVSSALDAMHRIVRTRYRPADWNIYAAQASDGDNSHSDADVTGRLLTGLILPVTQFFAYLEVGESGVGEAGESKSSLWTLYQSLRSEGASLSMRKVCNRSEIFPVFHELFHRRNNREKAAP